MTNNSSGPLRSSLAVTISVWKALFLRESISRLSAGRGAWVWLLAEPIIHVAIMLVIFTVIRVKVVGGIDVLAWLIVGLTFISVYKRTSSQVQNAINANKPLFAYRQVRPVDTLLARGFLEGFLAFIIILITCISAIFLLDVDLIPDEPDKVLLGFLGMWLMGLGFGLVASVATQLIPELGKILGMLSTPIFMTSGAMIPLHSISEPYRSWLLYNPLVHGLETARQGVSSYYHAVTGTDLSYLYQFALVTIFLGLALHARFEAKILSQ